MKKTLDWKLTDIYQTEDEATSDFERIKLEAKKLCTFKGRLNNKESILEFLSLDEKISIEASKVSAYAFLRKSLCGKDEFARKLEGDLINFEVELSTATAFVESELAKNSDEMLLKLAGLQEFARFSHTLKEAVRSKSHILTEEVEKAISMNPSFGMGSDVFDALTDIDFSFGKIKTSGGMEKVTHATYAKFMHSADQNTRKEAYKKMHGKFKEFNFTLGTMFLASMKENIFFSKLHNHPSVLSSCCFGDHTDPKVLSTLIEAVHEHLGLFYDYARTLKQKAGLKEMFYYDTYLPIGQEKQFDYDAAADIVLKALSVMGEEYVSGLKKAMSEGWIDVYEKPNKASGGFSLSEFAVHSYVLLNYAGTYSDMSTIAHELGHAMHGEYSRKNQHYEDSHASIFICEVASIVNEVILANYMMQHATSAKEKAFYINNFLSNFYATVYRQTMFSEFEDFVYKQLESGKPLITEDLNSKYEALQSLYFGEGVKKTDEAKYEWSRIPHFYRPYYVYKYATGFVSACTIASKLMKGEKGYREKYINLLKAGDSIDPISLLKTVDVDLTDKKTFDGAFELFKTFSDELKEIKY